MRPSVPVQMISRLPGGKRITLRIWNRLLMHLAPRRTVLTYYGALIDCDVRDMIQATITHFGIWEPRLSALFGKLVKPGDTVVDIGANVGYYSLLFSRLAGETGRVVAIEALPKLAATVTRHSERNDCRNIRVANVAASDRSGTATLYEAPGTNIGMTTMRSDRGFSPSAEVSMLPLIDILTNEEISRVSVIKIDIEGAEIPLVSHLLDNFARFAANPHVVVETSVADNPEWLGLFDRFSSMGFRAYDLHNEYDWMGMLNPVEKAPTPLDRMPQRQADILFTRRPI